MSDQLVPEADAPEPANLRFLRRLVTTLTATMIFGLIAIFVLLVIRLQTPTEVFPDLTALPDDVVFLSITKTAGAIYVIDQDQRLYILSPDGTDLRQTLPLN